MSKHIPVMLEEALRYLDPQKGENYIDATVGEGGHAEAICKRLGKNGKILVLDQNSISLDRAQQNLKNYKSQCIFVNDNFANIKNIVQENKFNNIKGILYDLGLASWQIDTGCLGITFSKDEPLDMRLQSQNIEHVAQNKINNLLTAKEIINKFPVKKIADILYQYGDVKNSWSVARRIDISRRYKPIKTTFDLLAAIDTKNPKILAPIFQALRIYVNRELENLQTSLDQALDLIEINGKIVVISFHSGEDRIVKNIFRNRYRVKKDIQILTKKPLLPKELEIRANPRSRSAKLRAIKKIK